MKTSAKSEVERIREKLGHFSLKRGTTEWIDLGFPELNSVLGHRDKGMLYGQIVEISGENSTAKTALALTLAALVQADGAGVNWCNFEGGAFDYEWANNRGLNTKAGKFNLVEPYVGKRKSVWRQPKSYAPKPRR